MNDNELSLEVEREKEGTWKIYNSHVSGDLYIYVKNLKCRKRCYQYDYMGKYQLKCHKGIK